VGDEEKMVRQEKILNKEREHKLVRRTIAIFFPVFLSRKKITVPWTGDPLVVSPVFVF